MPSNFAHYLFGQQLIPRLPDYLQNVICPNLQLYQIGQHGPDIIFYHRPFLLLKSFTVSVITNSKIIAVITEITVIAITPAISI